MVSLPKWKGAARGLGAVLAVFLFFGGAAAGAGEKATKEEPGIELAKAPAASRDWRNPYEGKPEAVRAGKKLFLRHCASCHGSDGRGGDEGPDLHSRVIQSAPPGVIFWFLKNGDLKDGMPSWSRLPDQRLWQLVSYLKTLKTAEEGFEKEVPVPPMKDPQPPSLP